MVEALTLARPHEPQAASGRILETKNVSVHFAGLQVLADVSLRLVQGHTLGLIGPNGAGKTTLVNVLSGFLRPAAGSVAIGGKELRLGSPAYFVRAGVVRTFQNVRLFPRLSVRENIEAAVLAQGFGRFQAAKRCAELLEKLDLARFAEAEARAIPYGDERRVGIARALAAQPRFLLLDEPAAGLNAAECDALVELVSTLPSDFGCGVLLIEHNMNVVMGLCRDLHVLDGGRTVALGPTETVRYDPNVVRAYLGSGRRNDRVARGQ
jgi:branched-chain amino acid transport system ATP-binding protein